MSERTTECLIPKNYILFLRDKSGSLADNISTDAIFPTENAYTTENLGSVALTGYPGIETDQLQQQKINVIAAGDNFGCGSAREQAPLSLLLAGVELVIAPSFDPRFKRNCANLGILTSCDSTLTDRLQTGQPIPREEIIGSLDPLEQEIVRQGGLIPFTKAHQERNFSLPLPSESPKPLTMMEKIIALNLWHQLGTNFYPQAGDIAVLQPDVLASYEFFTSWIFQIMNRYQLEPQALAKLILFSDHAVQSRNQEALALLTQHANLADQWGVSRYPYQISEEGENNAYGICHTLLRDEILSPGDILLMTDSHTPTAGVMALGLATSITGMTAALATGEYITSVPGTVRINLEGHLSQGVTPKDVSLFLNAKKQSFVNKFRGQCLEFGGKGIQSWSIDELAVLTNMATEGVAETALTEPTETTISYLADLLHQPKQKLYEFMESLKSDPGADFSHQLIIDLNEIPVMVAEPGSPMNGIALENILERPEINVVYIGSCTGGSWPDMIQAAQVLKNRKVKAGVRLYLQPSTTALYQRLIKEGLMEIFSEAGATVLPPACGACCGEGLGGPRKGEVGVSTSNRNFPGRMGEGDVYLGNTLIATASAIKGVLCHSSEL